MPTIEELLTRAIADAPAGRHEAGLWLACQLRDNGFTLTDASEVMRGFAQAVPQDHGAYKEGEALSTLRGVYRGQSREPWSEMAQEPRFQKRRPPPQTCFRKPPPPKDPESVARLEAAIKNLAKLEGSPAAAYLEGRELPWALAGFAGVKYCPDWDGQGPAVVFPVRDGDGALVAAQGRYIERRGFKTLGPRSLGLFATEGAATAEVVAVAEAPIDALTLALVGIPAVAMCGASGLPDWFLRERGKRTKRGGLPVSRVTFVATDSDKAGQDAAFQLIGPLEGAGSECVRLKPSRKDWNEVLTADGIDAVAEQIDHVVWTAIQVMPERPDPRPDLPNANWWLRTLKTARKCAAAFGMLHYLRCTEHEECNQGKGARSL